MAQPANTQPDDEEYGPDLLSDPTFVPCRLEGCPIAGLHREHEITVKAGRKIHEGYDKCPACRTPVIVTKTKRKLSGSNRTNDSIEAYCPKCGWAHSKALKRTSRDA